MALGCPAIKDTREAFQTPTTSKFRWVGGSPSESQGCYFPFSLHLINYQFLSKKFQIKEGDLTILSIFERHALCELTIHIIYESLQVVYSVDKLVFSHEKLPHGGQCQNFRRKHPIFVTI